MTIHPREKPDLSVGGGGIVDPEFITAPVRRELLLHLKRSRLTDGQKEALLVFANDIGQMVTDRETEPAKLQRMQIEAVEANARRLLASIATLGRPAREALEAHVDFLAWGSAPPIELDQHIKAAIKHPSNSLLSSVWDWVATLEKAAEYTAAQYNIDKQSKPEQMRARGYVAMLAQCVRDLTGAPPPKDRSSWFAGFAGCVGAHLSLEIGPRIVASGIEATR